jgi:hypothetical protein
MPVMTIDRHKLRLPRTSSAATSAILSSGQQTDFATGPQEQPDDTAIDQHCAWLGSAFATSTPFPGAHKKPIVTDESRKPQWEPHLQLVFSVLVGVSFAQSLSLISASKFSLFQLLLIATVFYVVLDNWYSLNVELAHEDVHDGIMVWVYLLALVAYSCLPFLYLSHEATGSLEPPEFLLANLSAICLLDAIRRSLAIRDFTRSPSAAEHERERVGKQLFLAVTGYVYFALLGGAAAAFTALPITVVWRAACVPVIWLALRGVDNILIPKLSNALYNIRAAQNNHGSNGLHRGNNP